MFTTLAILACGEVCAQAPPTLWTKTYSAPGYGVAHAVQETTDGGFVLAGFDDSRAFLMRTDARGDALWTKRYTVAGQDNIAWDVDLTADGGFVLGGEAFGGDACLIRTDASGNVLSENTYDGEGEGDRAFAVKRTADGGFALAGQTARPERVMYDGNWWDSVEYPWLIRTDATGDTLWTKTYRVTAHPQVGAWDVDLTADGGFVLGGWTGDGAFLIVTDADGNLRRVQAYGSLGLQEGKAVEQTADGGFILAGSTGNQAFLMRASAHLQTVWSKTYPKSVANDVQQTADGGFVFAGTANFDTCNSCWYVVRTDGRGNTLWTKAFEHTRPWSEAWAIQQTVDGGFVVVGRIQRNDDDEIHMIRLGATGVGITEEGSTQTYVLSQDYPNPFNPATTVSYDLPRLSEATLTVYDVLGRQVSVLASGTQPAGTYEVSLDASDLPSGVYFYRLQAGDFVETKRMVVVR